jgi:hypothetical protein
MTTSLIDFTVLKCKRRAVTEQKWADLRTVIRYDMVELRAKFKKRL